MQPTIDRRIAVVFGTRPEAIKLAPVILRLKEAGSPPIVVTTGQHSDLVTAVLKLFEIGVDHDLALMKSEQSLDYVLSSVVTGVGGLLDLHRPDAVVVQGDTTSTLGAALAAFHRSTPVAHVEAGLRSGDMEFPFPEEMNRRATTLVSRWHFAPTPMAAANLAREGVTGEVIVTGNTIVDAMAYIVRRDFPLPKHVQDFVMGAPLILATAHRRESWSGGIEEVALALRDVLHELPEFRLVFVTHPNPRARRPAEIVLANEHRSLVLPALDYPVFLDLLQRARLVVSDSGGVQEEAPTMGVPALVTRAITERPEGVRAGAVRLVGADRGSVRSAALRILTDPDEWLAMAASGRKLYGDGHAAQRIVESLLAG